MEEKDPAKKIPILFVYPIHHKHVTRWYVDLRYQDEKRTVVSNRLTKQFAIRQAMKFNTDELRGQGVVAAAR